jgi:hypothetical protein
MMQQLLSLLIIQLYWVSIVIGGVVLCRALLARFSGKKSNAVWREYPLPVTLFLGAAAGFTVFVALTVIGYALRLPAWTIALAYVAGMAWAAYYTVRIWRPDVRAAIVTVWQSARSLKVFSIAALLLVVLVADYCLSLWIGGYLDGDSIVHISKIRHLVEQGFTLTDAYFGVGPETRHHLSVTHTLYAVPAWFGIDPTNVWFYSLGFFRLLKWAAIFFLAWHAASWLNKARATYMARWAAVFGIILLSGSYTIQYPGSYAGIWVAVFIVGLWHLLAYRSGWLLLMGSALVAFTHPLAATASFFLLGIVAVAVVLFDRKLIAKRTVILAAVSGFILLTTPVFTQTLPNRMTEFAKNYGMERYSFYDIGPLSARLPGMPNDLAAALMTLVCAVGYLYLLFKVARTTSQRIVLGSVALFVPLILYNPLLYPLLSQVLPAWALNRFGVVNQLTTIVCFFGVWCIATWLVRRLRQGPGFTAALLALVLLLIVPVYQSFNRLSATAPMTVTAQNEWSRHFMAFAHDDLLPKEQGAIVYDNDIYRSFYYPAAASVHVVAILESSATPSADMVSRTKCEAAIRTTLDPSLLKAADVAYVLAWKTEPAFYGLAAAQPFLKDPVTFEAPHGLGEVTRYRVDVGAVAASKDICRYKE